ncbi:MAG: hypothetical protein KR126chlam1_00326 [Chlamydiae bacterium]|nr:hypothetical protein [Chlamydiota bacterium]
MKQVSNHRPFIFQPLFFFTNVVKSLFSLVAAPIKALGHLLSSDHKPRSLSGRTRIGDVKDTGHKKGSSSSTYSPSDNPHKSHHQPKIKHSRTSDSSAAYAASGAASKSSSSDSSSDEYRAQLLQRIGEFEKNGILKSERKVIIKWLRKYSPSKEATSSEDIKLRALFIEAKKAIRALPKKRTSQGGRATKGKQKAARNHTQGSHESAARSNARGPSARASSTPRNVSINEGQLSASAAVLSGKLRKGISKEGFLEIQFQITAVLKKQTAVENILAKLAIATLRSLYEAKKTAFSLS